MNETRIEEIYSHIKMNNVDDETKKIIYELLDDIKTLKNDLDYLWEGARMNQAISEFYKSYIIHNHI